MRKQPVCWPWDIYFNTSVYHFVSVLADEHPLNPFCTYSGVHHLETTCWKVHCVPGHNKCVSGKRGLVTPWWCPTDPTVDCHGMSWIWALKIANPRCPVSSLGKPPCLCPSDFSVHPLTSQPPGFSARVAPIWFVLNCCGYPWTLPTWGLELLDYCPLNMYTYVHIKKYNN